MPSDQDLHYSLDVLGYFDQEANSVDPDKMTRMFQLIWIYTFGAWDNSHIHELKGQV